jgi:hypothetical protein
MMLTAPIRMKDEDEIGECPALAHAATIAAKSDENLARALAMLDSLDDPSSSASSAKTRPPRPVSAVEPRSTLNVEQNMPLTRAVSAPGFKPADISDAPAVPEPEVRTAALFDAMSVGFPTSYCGHHLGKLASSSSYGGEAMTLCMFLKPCLRLALMFIRHAYQGEGAQPASRLSSLPRRATINRPINLISEESGEDDPGASPRTKPAQTPIHQLNTIISETEFETIKLAVPGQGAPASTKSTTGKAEKQAPDTLASRKTRSAPAKGKGCAIC